MRKFEINNQKAITLIALVITIIVLLILAGVTISTLSGENGLLNKARIAKETSINLQIQENTTLADYETKIDESVSSTRDTVTIDKEEYEKLKEQLNSTTATSNDITLGKKAYSNGELITGTRDENVVYPKWKIRTAMSNGQPYGSMYSKKE